MGSIALKHKSSGKFAVDPVCGMKVDPGTTGLMNIYQEKAYYFCSKACRKEFEEAPYKCLKAKLSKPKGWWRRYLERLAKSNEELFGGRSNCCQ